MSKFFTQREIAEIAAICHEANRAYCITLGDNSQLSWDEAPSWQRDSAILGVEFHVANPYAGPEASHESWMKQKLDESWVYGPVKNPETKEHPCLVPFNELPLEQQRKDVLFRAIVHAFLDYP